MSPLDDPERLDAIFNAFFTARAREEQAAMDAQSFKQYYVNVKADGGTLVFPSGSKLVVKGDAIVQRVEPESERIEREPLAYYGTRTRFDAFDGFVCKRGAVKASEYAQESQPIDPMQRSFDADRATLKF